MDDVAFMRSNNSTVQETYLFMVDSRNRDRTAYPHAHEYTVEFNAPFRNVCSFALLDATVPRTHYSVDEGKNTLRYRLEGDPETFEVTVPPGDYNVLQLTEALNAKLFGGLRVEPSSTPYDVTNTTQFLRSSRNFTLDMGNSSLRTALGFAAKTYSGELSSQETTAYTGPFQDPTLYVSMGPEAPVRQTFTAVATGTPKTITVSCDPSSATLSLRLNLTLTAAETQEVVAEGSITPSRSATAVLTSTNGTLTAGLEYVLSITPNEATQAYVNITNGIGKFETSADGGSSWEENTDLQLCMGVEVTSPIYKAVSPHLVDITGEKVVLIRCPEIEQVMFRERFHEQKVHAGLGYVKLGGLGYREQRSDYFTPFPPRTFHPISKVSKFTIRLENPDGSLYNTRGVDHFLLLMITYYKVTGDDSNRHPNMLNPHYNPDIHTFLQNKWQNESQHFSATLTRRGGGIR